ncbi:MAG: SDR family NAD(P)-dependent oxidoreductase [Planctomycetes bacterium]|nr:SDR family NAD(P)-dependent oxidoreductase [Planctomycetota bacterium]
MSPLSGTIVVVGASSGIGEALAVRLAHDARPVAILARRRDELERIAARANEKVGTTRVHVYEHDVTDRAGIGALWDRIETELGPVDELHYVAGVMPMVEIEAFPTDLDAQMLEVNALGCMAWCNEAARRFVPRGRGHIVGVSSVAALRGRMDRPGYNASKAAQDSHLEALRNRLWRRGVWVTTVRPGPVTTPMTAGMKVPLPITAERCAKGIVRARDRRAAVAHVPWIWRPIMMVIRSIPSFLFRRLSI